MEKVVRTQPAGLDPTKELNQLLQDGWKVKMCNSMRRCDGTEYLEYIIAKDMPEDQPKWFSAWGDQIIQCGKLKIDDSSVENLMYRSTKKPEQ